MEYPCLNICLNKISYNARIINDRCTEKGISVVGVSKCMLGDKNIINSFIGAGIKTIGDSRLRNIRKIREYIDSTGRDIELMLLRTPMMSEIGNMLDICDISMNTELDVIKAISDECKKRNITHRIILMIETGDKREGILPEKALEYCKYIKENCRNIRIYGLGTNGWCISNKIPEISSLLKIVELKKIIEKELHIEIPVVSGGNSSIWKYIEVGTIPEQVNQVRIGEAILMGHETTDFAKIKGAFTNNFSLDSEVIEIKQKDGKNHRIIIALGLQDVGLDNIICTDPGLVLISQSSDHTVLAIENKRNNSIENIKYRPGDVISFNLNYFGLLSCMTSPFIKKNYIQG